MKLKGRSKEKKLLSWRETWKINLCAVKLIYARYPGALISRIVRVIFAALSPYVGIYLSARIIDEIAGARDTERLIHLVLTALFAAAAISLFNSLLSQWCNVENADRYFKNNHILTRKMLEMDFISVDDTKTHEMLSTILQNQNSGGWGLNRTIGLLDGIISSFFTLTGGFALTATLFTSRVPENSSLAVLNQPLSVLLILALMVSVTCLAPVLSTKANSFWAKKSNLHNESNRSFGFFGFLGYKRELAPDVRIYRQDRLCQKYNMDKRGTFAPKGVFAEYARGKGGLLNAASAAVSVIFTGLVYLFVCLKSWAGAFGVGAVTQYVASVTALAGSISSILTTAGDMRNNASFLKLILDFLDIPNSMYKGSLTVEKRSDNRYEIEFRNVSFRYPGAEAYALKDVSLVFQTGERLAVVGMNGSGKTTFIKLLCRLYDPTEGEILLNGINIQKYDYFEYMSIFSVVFQDFKLFSFTVGQNVAAKLAFDREKVESCLQKAGFASRLSEMSAGMDTWLYKDLNDSGVEVSGGEGQKIALARALYKDSPFIILDEPTAALDPQAEAEIYSRFSEIVGDKTAVYISHRLSSCRFCDNIAVFDNGNIVQRGSHEELLGDQNGKYSELWNAQAQYYTEDQKQR